MSKRTNNYSTDPEARKVVARNVDLPQCEGLRVCAALTSIAQFVLISNQYLGFDLTIVVQIGFGLIGFMVAAYLLRDRDLTTESEVYNAEGFGSSIRGLIRTLPLPQMATVVVLVLLLPHMTALEGFKMPDMAEVPAIIIKMFSTYFSDFQRSGFNGRNLLIFPMVILFVPRRCLSMVLLTVLGSGLVIQFAGLFSGSIRPAAMVESPSAFDLLAAGCILAVISRQRRIGRSEAQIGTSAVLSGFLLAGGLVGARLLQASSSSISAVTLFPAPSGFGVSNFVIEIVGTTLVASLFWKDLGGMMEDVTRAPAH